MLLDDIAQDQISPSPFAPETLQKIENGIIVDISDKPINTDGAYGDLFSGYHTVLGLKVAMKRPRGLLRRSFREGHTWMIFRDMQHPNILPFLGIYEHDECHHLVSPFMENGTLDIYLSAHPEADRATLLRQAAGGLAHMHGLKIVHGDIKANNILVTSHGRVFVCDFGLSQILELRKVAGAYSVTGSGNLRWASPELIEPDEEDCEDIQRTFQSDVWAFGMTIYQVLSEKLPYDGKRDYTIIKAILTGSLPEQEPLASPSGRSYKDIWEVSSHCLRRHPSERLSMSEVAVRLGDNYDPEVSSFEKTVELGKVLIADHPKHGMVVLDRFRRAPKLQANGLPTSDFQVELWASLRHPNILPFLGVCVVGLSRRPFLMSSYMDQGTIQDYLLAHPDKSRKELLCQAAQAILYLHEELIVHGEIRAENLIMSGIGRVLLSGFGSSALIGGAVVTGASPPAQLARWNSPEVLTGGSKTFASDVYAFGMTVYEVLSGQIPFADLPTEDDVIVAVLHHSRPCYWGDPALSDRYQETWTVVGASWIPEWTSRPLMSEVIQKLRKADSADAPAPPVAVHSFEALEEPTLNAKYPKPEIDRNTTSLESGGPSQPEDVPRDIGSALRHHVEKDEDPIAHMQYDSPFLSCPNEVVIKILTNFLGADLMVASFTCRLLRYIIRETTILQYHLELFNAGLTDEYEESGFSSVADRLYGLREQEDRWRTLSWRRSEVMHAAGNYWDVKGGAYVSEMSHEESSLVSLQLWQFPSLWRGRLELTEVVHKDITAQPFGDCAVDIDQDLLILLKPVAVVPDEQTEQMSESRKRFSLTMHVRSLSGNYQHPLAEVETSRCEFHFPADAQPPELSIYPPRIAGEIVLITIQSQRQEVASGRVIVWRWTDSVQLLVIDTFAATAEFLSEKTLVTTGVNDNDDTVLHIYELPSSSPQATYTPELGEPQPSMILELPHLRSGSKLPRCPLSQSGPQPGAHPGPYSPPSSSSYPRSPPAKTFGLRKNPETRIITFSWPNYVLVVHASKLLDCFKSRREGPGTVIPWREWSQGTRWIPHFGDISMCCTFEQKYVRRHETLNAFQILDFNPHKIVRKRPLGTSGSREKKLDTDDDDASVSDPVDSSGERLVLGPLDFEDEVFDDVTTLPLPYLESTSAELAFGPREVMITDEHIVIKGDNDMFDVLCF